MKVKTRRTPLGEPRLWQCSSKLSSGDGQSAYWGWRIASITLSQAWAAGVGKLADASHAILVILTPAWLAGAKANCRLKARGATWNLARAEARDYKRSGLLGMGPIR